MEQVSINFDQDEDSRTKKVSIEADIDNKEVEKAVVELANRMEKGSLTVNKYSDGAILVEFKALNDEGTINFSKKESLSRKSGYEDELQQLISNIIE